MAGIVLGPRLRTLHMSPARMITPGYPWMRGFEISAITGRRAHSALGSSSHVDRRAEAQHHVPHDEVWIVGTGRGRPGRCCWRWRGCWRRRRGRGAAEAQLAHVPVGARHTAPLGRDRTLAGVARRDGELRDRDPSAGAAPAGAAGDARGSVLRIHEEESLTQGFRVSHRGGNTAVAPARRCRH